MAFAVACAALAASCLAAPAHEADPARLPSPQIVI